MFRFIAQQEHMKSRTRQQNEQGTLSEFITKWNQQSKNALSKRTIRKPFLVNTVPQSLSKGKKASANQCRQHKLPQGLTSNPTLVLPKSHDTQILINRIHVSARCFMLRAFGTTSRLHIVYHRQCPYLCGTLHTADSGRNTSDHKRQSCTAVLGQKSQNP